MKLKLKTNKYLWQTSSNRVRVDNRVKNRVYNGASNRVWIFIAQLETRSGHGAEKRQPVTCRCKNKS